MIENRHCVTGCFEPIHTESVEAPWVGRDLSSAPAEGSRKRVLVVEDEEPLRACLRMMLEMEGHQVTEAGNGAEGLQLFKMGEFDLVITDFEMPVMQGNKLAVGIKLLAPSLPILMVTGSGDARRDARNPVDALLRKPFRATDLRCALAKLFPVSQECSQAAVVPTLENSCETSVADEQMVMHLQA